MFWISIGFVIGISILLLAVFSKSQCAGKAELPDREYYIILFFLFLLFAFLLLFKSNEIPIPFHVDEVGVAYDGLSISNHHRERFGYVFPVYFSSGINALSPYLTAISIRILGYSVVSVRLPAILLSMVTSLVFAFMMRAEYGNAVSAISMWIFCFLPFSIMHSRWALESYLLFPMLIISCGCFFYAVRKGKKIWFFFSGILFGVTLYSYAVSYTILPLFLVSVIIYLLVIKKIGWAHFFPLLVPLVLFAIPLLLMLAVNNGLISEIKTGFISIPKLVFYRGNEVNLKNVINNLRLDENNMFYRIFVYDQLIYNVIPKFGTVYYFTIPFIIYGFFLSIKQFISAVKAKLFTLPVLFLFIFASVFLNLLVLPYSNVNRACALFFPLIYFLVNGFYEIVKKSKTAALIFGGFFLLFSMSFICYYFSDFPKDLSHELSVTSMEDLEKALDFAERENRGDTPITIYGLSNPYLYTLLVKHIDPYTFNETKVMTGSNVDAIGKYWFRVEDVSPERIYLIRTEGWVPEEIRQYEFNVKEFGTVTVYYP